MGLRNKQILGKLQINGEKWQERTLEIAQSPCLGNQEREKIFFYFFIFFYLPFSTVATYFQLLGKERETKQLHTCHMPVYQRLNTGWMHPIRHQQKSLLASFLPWSAYLWLITLPASALIEFSSLSYIFYSMSSTDILKAIIHPREGLPFRIHEGTQNLTVSSQDEGWHEDACVYGVLSCSWLKSKKMWLLMVKIRLNILSLLIEKSSIQKKKKNCDVRLMT